MKKKKSNPGFEDALQMLRSRGFEVNRTGSGALVAKYGAGAVLEAGAGGVAFVERPGLVVGGAVARLLDRGYQKFFAIPRFELPATAAQLQAVHAFSEELKALVGGTDLYNESLGTTSDSYRYDRVQGRETTPPQAGRPWELAGGH